MNVKNLYIFLYLYVAFLVTESLQQECHTERFDLCVAPVFLTARRALIPQDEKALESRCEYLNTMWKCIDHYMDTCTAEEHHLMFDLATDDIRMVTEEFCEKGSKLHTEFLKYSSCLAIAFSNARHNCLNNLDSIIYQITGDDVEVRVPAGCCLFNQFYECFFNHLEAACGREAFPVVKRTSHMSGANYIRHACATYNPSGNICMDVLNRNVTTPIEKNAFFARAIIAIIRAYH